MTHRKRRVSVVIPAFNDGPALQRCLASLRSQTEPAYEIIVVNNNSTDNTATVARAYGARLIDERVQGIWAAAARGYDAARGEIIARCDADSVLPATWLAAITRSFTQATVIAVTGPGDFVDTSPAKARLARLLYMQPYFWLVGAALGHPPLFGSNFAMTRTAWHKVRHRTHRHRQDLHDDIDLSHHLSLAGVIRYDGAMRVGISARPFRADSRRLADRYVRGLRSLLIHWHDDSPLHRYRRTTLERLGRH